ncbi:MAG: phosphatidic acid phosphatase [Clostridia bacterium]|nr:phosphatidic acid phosphatase [Clostridia bacterium]
MRKPVVDYRNFRLSKINTPEFSHLKYLLGWVGYFIMYVLTENLIPRENCHVVHSVVDDLIPFCEVFVIPYVFWYALVAGSLLWFALYNVDGFKKLSTYIIITQIIAMTVYIIFPNCQNLRPDVFARDNIFTKLVGLIYTVDTSTNVCPSLHVGYSLGILSVWLREKTASKAVKIFVGVTVLLVCMSVTFIKQHSFVDVIAAIPMCLIAEYIVFYRRKK